MCDSDAQRQRRQVAAGLLWPSDAQHERAARGVLRVRGQGGELGALEPAEDLVDPVARVEIAPEVAHLPHQHVARGGAHGFDDPRKVSDLYADEVARGAT